MTRIRIAFAAILLTLLASSAARAQDPLPSWNDGPAKKAIVGYDEAKKKGWTVISMKNDWKRIFAFEQ